jgi:hypothetical protein
MLRINSCFNSNAGTITKALDQSVAYISKKLVKKSGQDQGYLRRGEPEERLVNMIRKLIAFNKV